MSDIEQFSLIATAKRGIPGRVFNKLSRESPLSLTDWSNLLGLSRQTIERYKREGRRFDVMHSDRILQLDVLLKRGREVFGDRDRFYEWLRYANPALGGVVPLDLAVSSFGVNLLMNELGRIEHGIFA